MKTLLLLAHPGHELRVFHWMEQTHPEVFVLTDGSGGDQSSRTSYSKEALSTAGAKPGQSFGAMTDKQWYDAILARDSAPFLRVAKAAFIAAEGRPEVTVVADAVDGYNPVHDLASAIGAAVAARLVATGAAVTNLVSAAVPGVFGSEALRVSLDAAARERKMAAVQAYAPLAEEAQRIFDEAPESFGQEVLLQQDFDWPDDFEPHWERFARDRVATGRYANAISYHDHVLPIARAILSWR